MAFHRAILVVFFLSPLAFQSSKADPIDDACSGTPDPNFCKTSFRSDSRSAGTDLKTLAQVGIDLTKSQISSASSLMKNLAGKETNTTHQIKYNNCHDIYGNAAYELNDCASALKVGHYVDMSRFAYNVFRYAETCDDEFSEVAPEPDELMTASKQMRALSSAIFSISNKLGGIKVEQFI